MNRGPDKCKNPEYSEGSIILLQKACMGASKTQCHVFIREVGFLPAVD